MMIIPLFTVHVLRFRKSLMRGNSYFLVENIGLMITCCGMGQDNISYFDNCSNSQPWVEPVGERGRNR